MAAKGLDRIVEEILAQAKNEAQAIKDEAQGKADAALAAARSQAAAKAAEILAQAKKKALLVSEAAQSGIEQKKKQANLAARQEALGKALDAAKAELLAKPAKEYFDVVKKLASSLSEEGPGTMLFNEADLKRLPKGFEADLAKALGPGKTLVISKEPAGIDGGFLIKYGENIENCSFAALFRQRRDEFLDLAKEALF
ncbi:MAG: hypothetical protein LBT59_05985 [Clostridiales bacterium]|jgi:V/A-type H+-transporting ATPase subunit E|nr:hypothetical protein [Clostridiales bacterium]